MSSCLYVASGSAGLASLLVTLPIGIVVTVIVLGTKYSGLAWFPLAASLVVLGYRDQALFHAHGPGGRTHPESSGRDGERAEGMNFQPEASCPSETA